MESSGIAGGEAAPGEPMGLESGIRAVVLAAGNGTALCPLSNYYPKVAFPLGRDPLLAHLLQQLHQAGVDQAAVLANRSEAEILGVRPFAESGGRRSLNVCWFHDDGSKGTAGCLRRIEDFFGTTSFLVVQGNLYLDSVDLRDLMRVHNQRRSGVTVAVEEREGDVLDHETLDIVDGDVVRQFHIPHASARMAKPRAFVGIYAIDPRVLAEIDRGYTDIKEQLLPLLYERGIPVHVYRTRGIVRRLNTLDDYFRLNHAYLLNGVGAEAPLLRQKSLLMERVWGGDGVRISPHADLIGPVVLGDRCVIADGAQIIGPATIGDDVHIERNAQVRESIIWPNSRIGANSRVEYCLVADRCTVPANGRLTNALLIRNETVGGSYSFLSARTPQSVLGLHEGNGNIRLAASHERRGLVSRAVKRAMDIAGAIVLLVLGAPLLLVIAAAVRLTSPGPALFSQVRCGLHGRPFRMLKFRTMVADAEKLQMSLRKQNQVEGPMFKIADDPRITRLGAFLRKTSLDELPQLLNVLAGTMSLVGPRPLAMAEMSFAPSWRDTRLSVKPGVTGMWQVMGRESPRFHDWIRWDVEYVLRQSIWLDLWLLLKTLRLAAGHGGGV